MNNFDPTRYTISVRKENTEGGELFVGRVSELPDVAVYETTFKRAYDQVIGVIQTAKEMFDEDGEKFPAPEDNLFREYSGRINTRLPKTLHRMLTLQSIREGVSLNSHINYLLTWNAAKFEQRVEQQEVQQEPKVTLSLVRNNEPLAKEGVLTTARGTDTTLFAGAGHVN